MRGRELVYLAGLIAGVLLSVGAGSDSPSSLPSSDGRGGEEAKTAAVIELHDEIDDYTRNAVEKRFNAARAAGAKTIILDMHTPGGLVTSGLEISSFIKNQRDLHTIAYINTKAYSAGTMIALACNEIVMAPSAAIGDCAPIAIDDSGRLQALPAAERAKIESPILADFADSARRNGYDEKLAEAMVDVRRVVYYMQDDKGIKRFVDADQFEELKKDGWTTVAGVKEPVDGAGTLLTVQTDEAQRLGLARGVAASVDALAADRGLQIIRRYVRTAGDEIVATLSSNGARLIFIIIFIISLSVALHVPGHGAPEAVALISLALLIGMPLLTGYASWIEILIIFAGLALVAFEVFVFPGHFISAGIGALMVIGGLLLTFVGKEPGGMYIWPQLKGTRQALGNGIMVTSAAMVASLALWIWLSRYLPRLPYLNRLILTTTAGDIGTPTTQPVEAGPAVGDAGVAVTDLKPGGSARFITEAYPDGRVASVISDRGYVKAGTPIVIHEVAGNRIVVRGSSS